jgi:hypothetical protein
MQLNSFKPSHNMPKRQRNRPIPRHLVLRPDATRTRGSMEPPPVDTAIVHQYRAQIKALVGITSPFEMKPSVMATFIPGGASAWLLFRLIKVEVWGPDSANTGSPTLTLQIGQTAGSGLTTQGMEYLDNGTFGARRAHISCIPGSLFSLAWFDTGDSTTVLFAVYTDSTSATDTVVIQCTVECQTALL